MPNAADITSLRDLSVHFDYLRTAVSEIGAQVKDLKDHMATRVELEALRVEVRRDLDALGIEMRRELAAVRADMQTNLAAVRADVQAKSIGTQFERGLTLVTRICAAVLAVTAVCGAIALTVRFLDRVPGVPAATGTP